MTKIFAGLLEYYVVTYALKEAGFSSQTLRSFDNGVTTPTVTNWQDQDVLKRLKQMVNK